MKKICVLGSINIDIVTQTPRFALPGETLTGVAFNTFPGGKGANQGVAAGRLGADVTFLGMVGNDAFAAVALEALQSAGVKTDHIESADTSTGTATIIVNAQGENSIIVVPGANGLVDVDYVKRHTSVLDESDILMLQLETPLETVAWAAQYAAGRGKTVILDPAPAQKLPDALLRCCTLVTPNETELQIATGVDTSDDAGVRKAADMLLAQGMGAVLNKRGSKGARWLTAAGSFDVPGFKVKAVDTTAAGDSFNAGFAVSLAQGKTTEESIRYANAVGAIAVTKMGAQSAMPTAAEVAEFIEKSGR